MTEQVRQVAIVTGGSYGIGRSISRYFAARGFAVLIADINVQRGQMLQKDLTSQDWDALFMRTDVRDEVSVQDMITKAVEKWGRVDVLCNNAGVERYQTAEDYTIEDWNYIVQTNLLGTFLSAKYALAHLRKVRGSIINISSVQAIACEENISVYAATKSGILGLTRGLAIDYARVGVRVNAICPGPIRTGMLESSLSSQAESETVLAALANSVPLGRIGEPEDIAPLVYFLASREASFITGSTFVVDGGVLAKLAL